MLHILAWKNVVCIGRERCLLKNKEVKVCEILVMLPFVVYLTSHIYSLPEIHNTGESFLKWSLSNDNSQAALLNPNCQDFEQKPKTRKKLPWCWSQKLAELLLLQTEMFLRLPVRQTNVFFVRNRKNVFTSVLAVYQLGTFSDRESWIHHNLQAINIVIIAQKKD